MRCLEARGHEAVAPDLPLHDPDAGFEERARPALDALAGAAAGSVVVVGHSMGSACATLAAVARPGSLLVHLCPGWAVGRRPAHRTSSGRASRSRPTVRTARASGTPTLPWLRCTAACPRSAARALAQHLRPMAPPAGEYPLPGPPDIPTELVYAADDEIFEPAWERFMARELLGIEPIEIPGGHFPMAEAPEALAGLLDRLAGEHALMESPDRLDTEV